jgi:membrane protease YdiL (CAAX protease family)
MIFEFKMKGDYEMASLFFSELKGSLMQLVLFALIPFIWWYFTARKKENFNIWIGLKAPKKESSFVITVFVTTIASLIFGGLSSLCIRMFPEGVTAAGSQFAGKGYIAVPAILAYGYIRTGLSEEVLFRGFLLKRIASRYGFIAGNTIQAIVFGLLHGIPFGVATRNVIITILLTILPGACGWFLGWLNEKCFKGSIVPSWLLHGTSNFIVACLTL